MKTCATSSNTHFSQGMMNKFRCIWKAAKFSIILHIFCPIYNKTANLQCFLHPCCGFSSLYVSKPLYQYTYGIHLFLNLRFPHLVSLVITSSGFDKRGVGGIDWIGARFFHRIKLKFKSRLLSPKIKLKFKSRLLSPK